MKPRIFETDWLASRPVFYNERTGAVSYNVNEVIDFANVEFDPEGFNNYLDFGYSVLEQTPVKEVKFLRHSSRLTAHDDGRLEIIYLDDPVEPWLGKTSHEDDVLHQLETSIQQWEQSIEGEIIIPTSGGYDSRLLNFFVKDKSRIRSFTYGLSDNQSESYEVVYARTLAQILGTNWAQIELGDHHKYFDLWDEQYGISTHAHGMYHIEFYTKMLSNVEGGNPFLSGIIGDAWSGSVKIPSITNSKEIVALGYGHGLHADSRYSLLKSEGELRDAYFHKMREKIREPLHSVVEAMRFKIILLCYLMRMPEQYGFKPWSPFLDVQIALSMVTLPSSRRQDRIWQREFFQKHGLDLESMNLQVNHQNSLNLRAMERAPLKPLHMPLLGELVKPEYVEWINRSVGQLGMWHIQLRRHYSRLKSMRGGWRLYNRFDRQFKLHDKSRLEAYCAYLTLKPIENLLQKRALAQEQ